MEHQQKSLARVLPAQGFKSIATSGLKYTTVDVEREFLSELQGIFGLLSFVPVADGVIHRFQIPGDRAGSRNGWYVLYSDSVPSGAFGSWKVGTTYTWSARGDFDLVEREAFRYRLEEIQRHRIKAQEERQVSAATRAQALWRSARPASNGHPYLVAKGMQHFNLRQLGSVLLIPLLDIDLKLVNLQRITPNGAKRFLSGGRISGCFSPLGRLDPQGNLYICEGWATGATIHKITGRPVACAMNCGNLKNVAVAFRQKYPALTITVAGDDDRKTEGNPGRTKANEAALAVNGYVTYPLFCCDSCCCSDFSDRYLCQEGAVNGR